MSSSSPVREVGPDERKRASVWLISISNLSEAEVIAFLDEHLRQMRAVTPLESKHALSLEELRAPDVTFFVAREDGVLVGCGALKCLDASHGELKSMRSAPSSRRQGVATYLLRHLIAQSELRGLTQLSLETGAGEFFAPARALYAKFGFEVCDPFGHYAPDLNSVFMTRRLRRTTTSI